MDQLSLAIALIASFAVASILLATLDAWKREQCILRYSEKYAESVIVALGSSVGMEESASLGLAQELREGGLIRRILTATTVAELRGIVALGDYKAAICNATRQMDKDKSIRLEKELPWALVLGVRGKGLGSYKL